MTSTAVLIAVALLSDNGWTRPLSTQEEIKATIFELEYYQSITTVWTDGDQATLEAVRACLVQVPESAPTSWKVTYTARTGKPETSPAFGSEAAALAYSRTVKGGRVVPCTVAAPAVQVTVCPDPETVRAQRAQEADYQAREQAAESYQEAGSQARLSGASSSEALDAARDAHNSRFRRSYNGGRY